jgi:hypothetical protein
MASHIESPKVAFVAGSKLPASTPFWLSRLILPFIGIAIGASLGSAAGLTLAQVNARNETVAASSSDSAHASPASQAANFSQPANATGHSIAKSAVANLAVAKAHAQTKVHIALNKMPDAVKPAMFKLGGKEWRVARPIAIPVAQPVRQSLASVPAAAPTALDAAQSKLI